MSFFSKTPNLKVVPTRCMYQPLYQKVLATIKAPGTATSLAFAKYLRFTLLIDWKTVRSWFVFPKWIKLTSFIILPVVTTLKIHTVCVCFNVLIWSWRLCIAWKIIWINDKGKFDDFTTRVSRYLTNINKIIVYKAPMIAKIKAMFEYFPLFDSSCMQMGCKWSYFYR